ncbi:unnamed protein product [Ilex paraguariensis]|uniref:ubiquitinyl hydrolase 1 n=1 Tax=Ilex paraguariensis TaxID=185542 RepID=A0ABC8R8Y4_9AQUA
MGKKVKKKTRTVQKEKRVSTASPTTVSQPSILSAETADDAVSAVKERKTCAHLDKGIDLDKLSSKLRSSEPIRCEDCREGVVDRRAVKGKGKHGKNKGGGGSVDSKSNSKAIWVCLECGHFSCGGAGLPTTPQSHAVRHAKQNRHPLAVQFENPYLLWCFPCSKLIPVQKSEENSKEKDVLHDIVKLIKGQPAEGYSNLDAENVWFGNGSVTSEMKSENIVSTSIDSGGYVVRGLVNLGNTCFFNSVMQNLLAMDRLRDYFLKLEETVGPLTVSMKKLFSETSPESGLRNVIHPRSLFGCLCAKAPQFRGYQLHDSHELLRCLLDGLYAEDSAARKQAKSSQEVGKSPSPPSTFIDTIFGGQLSSTVTCLECGHSSVVHEPFLDLSLPVPTKKPLSKKAQPVSQAKKPKVPPKRSGRIRSKVHRDANPSLGRTVSDPSIGGQSSWQGQSGDPVAENTVAFSGDSTSLESVAPTAADSNGSALHMVSTTQESENKQFLEDVSRHDSMWMDYLELGAISDSQDMASQINDISEIQDSGNKDGVQNNVENTVETSKEIHPIYTEGTAPSSGDLIWLDYCEPDKLSDGNAMVSQSNDASEIQASENKDTVQGEVIEKLSLESCSQVCSMESNLKVDHSENFWEDEAPLQVQHSEILLLPYKEDTSASGEISRGDGEVSSSALGCEPDLLDFDGFGDLFNEPEAAAGPSVKPLSSDNATEANEVADVGFLAKNSSESDPDEVDHTDSPVSIDSCLAHFTKPELLSKNEHAWQCESCSKALHEQRMKLKKKLQKPTSSLVVSGGENRNPNAPLGFSEDCLLPTEASNLINGDIKRDAIDTSDESLSLHNGTINSMRSCTLETGQKAESNLVTSQLVNGKVEMDDALPSLLKSSSWYKPSCQACDSCSVNEPGSAGCNTDKVQNEDDIEDEETNSETVKVKRDATKRILINRAPPVLTFHLKRFSQDGRGRLSKLNGHVVFKDIIDLKPYMDPRSVEREKYNYRLVGVVEHLGNMRGGHYVAYVRGGAKSLGKPEKENGEFVWYYTSDGYVRESSLEEVLRCDAYILFYEEF